MPQSKIMRLVSDDWREPPLLERTAACKKHSVHTPCSSCGRCCTGAYVVIHGALYCTTCQLHKIIGLEDPT